MEEKSNEKLSYEQLEEAARQLSAQFDNVVKENHQLKGAIQRLQIEGVYTELNFRFKVLENAKLFPEEFVNRIIAEIQDVMTPKKEEEETKE